MFRSQKRKIIGHNLSGGNGSHLQRLRLLLSTGFATVFLTLPVLAEERALRLHHDCMTLDPIGIGSSPCYRLAGDVYETLLRVQQDGTLGSGVAQSWAWDFDAKTLTLKLREDRVWSDGAPVVAEDFILSWRRSLLNPDSGNPLIGQFKSIRGADNCDPSAPENCLSGVTAPDAKTLKIAFNDVDRGFPEYFKNGPWAPVPSHFVAEHGDTWSTHPDRPWNGAYIPAPGQDVETTLSEGVLHLVPNTNHPDFTPEMIQNVDYTRSNASMVAHVRDFTIIDDMPDIVFSAQDMRPEAEAFLEQNGWAVEPQNSIVFGFFAFDLGIIDPQLLEAVKLLMLPDVVVARTPGSLGAPISRLALIPSAAPVQNRFAAMASELRQKDAKEILETLGIDQNNPETLRLLVFDEEATEQVTIIGNYLRLYGIDLKPVLASYGERRARFEAGEAVGLFVNWFSSSDDPGTLAGMLTWTATQFAPGGSDAQLRAIADANSLPDVARAQAIARVEEHVINDGGLIPVFRTPRKLIYRDWLCGVVGNLNQIYPTHWIRQCDG